MAPGVLVWCAPAAALQPWAMPCACMCRGAGTVGLRLHCESPSWSADCMVKGSHAKAPSRRAEEYQDQACQADVHTSWRQRTLLQSLTLAWHMWAAVWLAAPERCGFTMLPALDKKGMGLFS